MFIEGLDIKSVDLSRYDYIQATEASVMEALFEKYINDLIAENVVRAAAQQSQLNVADMDIAGGGDGYTFVVRVLVTTATPALGWVSGVLGAVEGRFWMGSDAEALQDYQEAAIASLLPVGSDLNDIAVGHAGAAKGTRFMAFMAAAVLED